MKFTEDWYPQRDQDALTMCADRAVKAGAQGAWLEFGSWEGRTAILISNVIRPNVLVCVDPWSSENFEVYRSAERAYQRFTENTAGYPIDARRQSWQVFMASRRPERIAFCHIDAEHTYVDTHDAIGAVLPRLSPGGVLCGHDYDPRPSQVGGWPGVVRAVDETIPDRHVEGTVWWTQR